MNIRLLANPSAFECSNLVDAACLDCGAGTVGNSTDIAPDPDDSVYWDRLRFSAPFHEALGNRAFYDVPETSSSTLFLVGLLAIVTRCCSWSFCPAKTIAKFHAAVLFVVFASLGTNSALGQASLYTLDVGGEVLALPGDGGPTHEIRVQGELEVDVVEDIIVDSSLTLVRDGSAFTLPTLPDVLEGGVDFVDIDGVLYADGLGLRGRVVWGAANGANFGFLGERSSIVSATAFIYWPGPPEERVFLGDPDSRRVAIGSLVPEPSSYSITTFTCLILSVIWRRIRSKQ